MLVRNYGTIVSVNPWAEVSMGIQDQSKEQLIEELELLRREVAELKVNKAAFEAQKKLLENLVIMARYAAGEALLQRHSLLENWIAIAGSSEEEELLKASLGNVLDASVELTNAEKGSLFLFGSNGAVTQSILTRGQATPGERDRLIGSVLEKGLAGWVARHRQVGLISDTEQDDRWLTLPNQPYTARSALAVPILRGEDLLAIITMLHSQQNYFSLETVELMQITANQLALVLEVAAHKLEKAAFAIQRKLLENLVDMERSSTKEEVLKGSLQKTLDLAAELTAAEKGSLFLLEPSGKIADAILTRAEVTPKQREGLIGTVLGRGLAGWVSSHRQVGLISDTEKDDRWLTLPNQPYIVRSALAVPMRSGEELLGIITLLHSQPEHFSPEVAEQMQVTADQMALVLENARLYSKLDLYSKALDAELEKGRQIQIDFLPYEILQLPNWEIAAGFYPARQVSGDFYDTFELPGDNVGLVIADICDKGVGAALFMALMRSLIRVFSTQAKLQKRTSVILQENQPTPGGWIGQSMLTNLAHLEALQAISLTNEYVAQNHWKMSMFATMFFGVLEPATGLLTYINGGHEPLFIVGDSGIKETLKSTGPAVGMMPNMKFKIQQVQLEPGDILIGYTDGITEARAPGGEFFTNERLRSLLEQPATSAFHLLERIKTNVFTHIGDAPQFDDITMLAVQRTPLKGDKETREQGDKG